MIFYITIEKSWNNLFEKPIIEVDFLWIEYKNVLLHNFS